MKGFPPPDIREVYSKGVKVVLGCKTEVQLDNAGRWLRNYERLVQNSKLYPSSSKPFAMRTVNSLLSLLRIKVKAYNDI